MKMIRRGALVAAIAFAVSACGGSAEFGNGGGAAAGSTGVSGATSVSGATGVGGGTACGNVGCPAIGCVSGYESVVEPGECCPVCKPCVASCPAQVCDPGMTVQPVSGSCCAFTCVPDPAACTNGQAAYQMLRDQLLAAPNALSCAIDTDCKLLATNAYCGDACLSAPVSLTAAAGIESKLSEFASVKCSTCSPSQPPCAPAFPPSCVDGRCALTNPDPCRQGKAHYESLRDQLLAAPDALSCASDADCGYLPGNSACEDPCPYLPVNADAVTGILTQLEQFSTENCSTCSPVIHSCPRGLPLRCANEVCVLGSD